MKVTRKKFLEEFNLSEQVNYLFQSDLWQYCISDAYEICNPDDFGFNQNINYHVSNFDGSWHSLSATLQYIEENISGYQYVYQCDNGCWDEWHGLTSNELMNIIDEFKSFEEYKSLFLPDDDISLDGLEALL